MLSAETLRRARQIQIRTRRLVDGPLAGEYHSVFKGQGIEFAETREYVPGDDVRMIDWNVTARMGQPFVKRYVEERELTVVLLADISASQAFGSRGRLKTELLAELCSVLATSAVRNNDKVGLVLFTDRIEALLPPQKGRNRALRLVHELLGREPVGRGTDIGAALDYMNKVVHRRAVVFLLSDFQGEGYERALRVARHRHDVIPIAIGDPGENSLPDVGLVWLQDPETDRLVLIDTGDPEVRASFAGTRTEERQRRRQLCRQLGLDSIELEADGSWLQPLMGFFRQRERRLLEGR